MRPTVVIGDCALDMVVSPKRPMHSGGDVPAAVRLTPGGQAANVAVRLARRGRAVELCAPLADDAGGALLREALRAERIGIRGLPAERSTVVVILVDADGERTMLSDRAGFPSGWPDRATALGDAGALVCSGYALLDEVGVGLAAALGGRPSNVPLAIVGCALASSYEADRLRGAIVGARPQLVVCNRDEARALLGDAPAASEPVAMAGELGRRLGALCVVTDAALGSAASLGAASVPAVPASGGPGRSAALDSTGAGDAYAAVLVDRLLAGAPPAARWPPPVRELAAAMAEAAGLAASVAGVPGAQARAAGEPPRALE